MARLNEPPVSADSLETLRRKLLRQNRDLAKSNNVRALRIRELENDCACMLSENLELRSRILELEKELEDNDARRIADHALAIKEKLESQLTEWGTLLAGLGLEPPMKRHSPNVRRRTIKPRLSFSSARPSPSQRRLRDIARDIEELGHISEQKSYPRMSMNPEQILALRSEADSIESPELGPPPMSQFIDEDPVKIDSPSRPQQSPAQETPKIKMEPPVALESPQSAKFLSRSPSPEKRKSLPTEVEEELKSPVPSEQPPAPVPQPAKTGSKRKLAARDDMTTSNAQQTNENAPRRIIAEKQSIREKVGNKTLKELASSRKESREKTTTTTASRKPLAAKSTNDDITSPKKMAKPVITDEVAAAKADLIKSKSSLERSKSKAKNPPPITFTEAIDPHPSAPNVVSLHSELATPEPGILSPCSPETASAMESSRGGTPPPADINGSREAPRPSRRNRTAVSYAEPNLRDKMRRPTKELLDAVAGEGKYVRRSSHAEPIAPESDVVKKENALPTSWKKLPPAPVQFNVPDNAPGSPLAGKGSPSSSLSQLIPMENGRRTSMLVNETLTDIDNDRRGCGKNEPSNPDSSNVSEVDIYEFTISSPQSEKETAAESKKKAGGRRASRRVSAAVNGEEGLAAKERAASRRRSMML